MKFIMLAAAVQASISSKVGEQAKHARKHEMVENTDFMFYSAHVKEMKIPPLPIWFHGGNDDCTFTLGRPHAKRPIRNGSCTYDEEA